MTLRATLYALLLIIFASCNQIDSNDYLVDYTPPITDGDNSRTILLEDYSGIRCANCPEAAAQAQKLKETYGNRIVVVSIHAGSNSRPIGNYDLRTAAGEEYADYYKIKSNPMGLVSRKSYNQETKLVVGKWDGAVSEIPTHTDVGIQSTVLYEPTTRLYKLNVKLTRYANTNNDSHRLIIWLVEDHIITPQETKEGRIPEYDQRHVFRGALNGSWGEPITLPELGETLNKEFSYKLPVTFNHVNCSVVVLLNNADSNEIMQVSETSFASH